MKARPAPPPAESDRAALELLKHLRTLRCFDDWSNEPLDAAQRRWLRRADRQQLLSLAACALLRASRCEA